ncbi:unnamed protein product [Sphenostylis stenocarpa]|uniref:Uncharacterized protein n=1 Tax=Sphenostylis stenocarpa TaxID=92480 RepID=A0AA86SCF4_9FABA|nr:unnamed protein product [Sphenostylis stenocarpa]
MQVDTTSNSNPRKKVVTNEGSDKEGAKMPKTNYGEDAHASNDSTAMKSHASEGLETFTVETMVGSVGNPVSKQDGSVSKVSSSGNLDMQERDLPEKANLAESISEQVINMACSQSVGQSDSEQHTISDQHIISNQHTEVFPSVTGVSNVSRDKQELNQKTTYKCPEMFSSGTTEIKVSGDTQEVNDKATIVDLQLDRSSPHHISKSDSSVGETITLGRNSQGFTNDPQPEKRYTSYENINKADALKKISCDNDNRENKETTSVCHLVPTSSRVSNNSVPKPVVEKMVLMKDKKLHDMESSMFSTPEGKKSLKEPSLTVGTKGILLGKKSDDTLLGSITQERVNFRSDTRLGSKMAGDSLTDSSKLMRDAAALLGSKDDLRSNSNTSSQVNPSCLTEKTARITTQVVSVNSEAEASVNESSQKITSVDGNKLTLKNCKITPALSSLKTSRKFGANGILTTSLHQKETKSIVRSSQNIQIRCITASKDENPIDIGNSQKPSTPFLKRKTIEVSEADFTSLRSLKRISRSPNESRNSKESSEEVVGEVESMPNNLHYNHSTPGLKSPPEIKVMEVEIPDSILMEDDRNVEKAEAYMKELEDICNMLKKKREEAEDLLIRAIVNDNNLLMLNHPIYEEKISSHYFVCFPPSHLIVDINAGYFLDILRTSGRFRNLFPS